MDATSLKYRCLLSLLQAVFINILLMDTVCSSFTTRCNQSVCNEHTNTSVITCNQSLIVIIDVTNQRMETDQPLFARMKRSCMARSSCNTSRLCSPDHRGRLMVHYYCVDASLIQSRTCDGQIAQIEGKHGYIQSPGYPHTTAKHCRWQFDLANNSFVTLYLYDVATRGTRESCGSALKVTGSDCDGQGQFDPRFLCSGDDHTTLVRCGKVDVELSSSKSLYPLRFWLAYYVQPKPHPANLKAARRSCFGRLLTLNQSRISHGMDRKPIIGDTVTSSPQPNVTGPAGHDDTQIFIILLFIFCGITLVLLVILIIVCIRCRQIRLSVSDHVYSEPSPSLQAHYDYISSLDEDKPRPKLVEEYFEVADALPADQRSNLPASPAYAEVEQFAQLKKNLWSSLGSSDWSDAQTSPTDASTRARHSDVTGSPKSYSGTPKSGVINRIVSERFTKNSKPPKSTAESLGLGHSHKDTGTNVFVVNLNRPNQSEQDKKQCQEEEINDYDDSSLYEQIDVCSTKNNNSWHRETDDVATATTPPIAVETHASCRLKEKDQANRGRRRNRLDQLNRAPYEDVVVKDKSGCSSRVNQIKEGLLSKNNNVTSGLKGTKDRSNCAKVAGFQDSKPASYHNKQLEVLATRNKSIPTTGKAQMDNKRETDTHGSVKATLKDGPRTQGIVKNGIEKFEHNSSL